MNQNFDASKLGTTILNIDGIRDALAGTLIGDGSVATYLHLGSEVVQSEDSGLASTMQLTSDVLGEIYEKVREITEQLSEQIEKYAKATLENESGTTQSLSAINSALEGIRASLSNI